MVINQRVENMRQKKDVQCATVIMNSEIIGMCIEVVMVRHTRSILRSFYGLTWKKSFNNHKDNE